ncbi:hypothetical protein F0562_016129 [Nyssa sinensis]|uniref:Protein kinase domain-containing protein n=1 Tax=Nyssa sinensis TaxID=561372 RepID=A0A5J4ZJ55_9ASTE|nr:hypothetical protein F0562_016129 [Nyssa sinensis]
MARPNVKLPLLWSSCFFLLYFFQSSSSQRTCPNCGSIEIPYPLSTNRNCGDPDYSLHCDSNSQKLYFDTLKGSSYLVLRIMASIHRMVVQPSPWLPGACVTQDMPVSEGIWLNQTLPFNITSSNTIFLLNCSPRLLISPLNCTPSSLCHQYLESSGHVDAKRAVQCASALDPCCTFVSGGMPSAYKIRLHSSGCRAFRSILHLDPDKPASWWEEGLEIQWVPPPEPVCKSQLDCSRASKCSPTVMAAITVRKSSKFSNQAKLAKAREDMLKSSSGGKPARMFSLKEVKKATNGFCKDRILGSGGYGEVYKAEQPLMIYEYISNGTLHDHLHGKSSTFLDWRSRLRIAVQTAEALAYLHSAAYTPIYHRDVKSTNILLDDDFNVKVADFGLSRLACPGLSHVSTCAQGTLGYLDPEYYRNYQLTDKSDVYSYGVVLLELLTSQKAIDFSRDQDDVNLAIYVSQRDANGSIMEVVDQRLLGEEPPVKKMESVKLFSDLALACLRQKKGERPSMTDVVQELQRTVEIVDREEASNEVSVEII